MSFLSRKNKTPRDEAKAISEGKAEPHHIGKYTVTMLSQEVYSLKNTKPMFRGSKWEKRRAKLIEECEKMILNNELNVRPIYNELLGDLSPLEI